MHQTGRPKTPAQWYRCLRDNGLRAALRILTVGQIYAIVSTAIAVAATLFGVLYRWAPHPGDLVPCATATGYPGGWWIEAGSTTVYAKDAFPADASPAVADYIWFKTPNSGVARSDEPDSGWANFSLAPGERIAPNGQVTMTIIDSSSTDPRPYVSVANLSVSSDGCYMKGTWSDNDDVVHKGRVKQKGTETLFWAAPGAYWVRRDSSQASALGNIGAMGR